MSGRRHHYLPQFLQRSFSHRRNGKSDFVHVHRRDKSFTSSLIGVGQERDFYGSPDDTVVDDAITEGEGRLANILQRLNDRGLESVEHDEVALLICAISVRTKAMRNAMSVIVPAMLDAAAEKIGSLDSLRTYFLSQSSDSKFSRKLDEALDEELRKLPQMSRELAARFKTVTRLRMKQEYKNPDSPLVRNAHSLLENLLETLRSRASSIANNAYRDAIGRDPHVPKRVEWLSQFDFHSIDTRHGEQFILGDCGVISLFSDGAYRLPLGRIDDAVKPEMFLLPISGSRCIAATASTRWSAPSTECVNKTMASLSHEFFVSQAPDVTGLGQLRSMINTATPFESMDEIRSHLLRSL